MNGAGLLAEVRSLTLAEALVFVKEQPEVRILPTRTLPEPQIPIGEQVTRIVRHGLADVLEWLGEDVGPAPDPGSAQIVAQAVSEPMLGSPVLYVAHEHAEHLRTVRDWHRASSVVTRAFGQFGQAVAEAFESMTKALAEPLIETIRAVGSWLSSPGVRDLVLDAQVQLDIIERDRRRRMHREYDHRRRARRRRNRRRR